MTLWRQAVIAMRVADGDGNVSHPMRILLRLLTERGPLDRIELALALEARDDGQAEYDRIIGLIPIREARERGAIAISDSTLNNAVKILPALALQLGLAADSQAGGLTVTDEGEALYRPGFQFGDIGPGVIREVRRRNAQPRRRAGTRRRRIILGQYSAFDPALFDALSPEEQIEAARLRSERTMRHQDIVSQVAVAFACDYEVYEDPLSFDALLVPRREAGRFFLLEIKTLDLDEVDQTRRAIGQLLWYSWMTVSAMYEGREIILGIVYDRTPTDETRRFLESLGIGAFSCVGLQIVAHNGRARTLCAEPRAVPENYREWRGD